jgi:NAD(P)-dependent dehydrogenase (short-subunit alcohol dehydrogenase family)
MSDSPFSLEGKNVLVTGASSGIGRATAIACSQQGARVFVTGRNEARLTETLSMLAGEGHEAVVCELTSDEDVKALTDRLPKLNGIVHCAGTQHTCITKMLNKSVLEGLMDTNFFSAAVLNAALMKARLLVKGASVVFVSSAAASRVAEVGNAAYSASKGALTAYSRVLAVELAPRNIRVNTVAPGMVRTALMEKFDVTEEEFLENEKQYPLGYGKPEDVAYAIVFLLSDASRWITGTELLMDGGLTLH